MRCKSIPWLLFALSGALSCVSSACDDDTGSGGTPPFTFDAGTEDSFAPTYEAGTGADAGEDASVDAGADADADADADAGVDADAGPPRNAIYAHINQTLVLVDPEAGKFTDVGPTNMTSLAFAWDDVAKIARGMKGPYSLGGAAAPQLITLDLCTGKVTDGPKITVGGVGVRRAEAIAQDPTTGTFYITVGVTTDSPATQLQSERTGTIDVATGAVTLHGTHTTIQNDGDALTFIGGTLKLLDNAAAVNDGALYTIDKTTGASSGALTTGATLIRIAYDSTRDVVFTSNSTGSPTATGRSIGKLNLATGVSTPVASLADGLYAGSAIGAVLAAPRPTCP